MSPAIIDVPKYSVGSVDFSDHCLVKVSFNGSSSFVLQANWALWKLNISVLNDPDLPFSRFRVIRRYHSHSGFEMFQQEVKNVAIKCCTVTSFSSSLREQHTLLRSFTSFVECAKPGAFQEGITLVKSQIPHREEQRFHGAAVRARSRRVPSAEHPTRQSFNEDRSHALSKKILELEHDG